MYRVCLALLAAAGPLPPAIKELANLLPGRNFEQMHQIIAGKLGPSRNVGFGVGIAAWDVESGALTLHPARGPSFITGSGERIWLLPTKNEALANIVGSYEMDTLPDPNNRGTAYWLGNVRLHRDQVYEYADSGTNREHRTDQKQNFFMRNYWGRYEIRFVSGVTAATLLESLPDKVPLCDIVFTPNSGADPATFRVTLDTANRRLILGSVQQSQPFRLSKSWTNFW